MKIIQIAGRSNTGKTTFIHRLLDEMTGLGRIGVIKHLGDHTFELEKGRDTTTHYEHGATISVGIDSDKSVAAIRSSDLNEALTLLCDTGMEYAIVEGFKTYPFPKVLLGDLECEGCILRNPDVGEVISSLDKFEDFYTMQGLVKELKRDPSIEKSGAILTFNGIVREWTDGEHTEYLDFDDTLDQKLRGIKEEIEAVDGILGVRFYHRRGRLYAGDDITYLAILAEHRQEAFAAASNAVDRLKRQLHDEVIV